MFLDPISEADLQNFGEGEGWKLLRHNKTGVKRRKRVF